MSAKSYFLGPNNKCLCIALLSVLVAYSSMAWGMRDDRFSGTVEIKAWKRMGLTLDEAFEWKKLGFFSPNETKSWLGSGFSPDSASGWRKGGFYAAEALGWSRLFSKDIDVAIRWKKRGFASAEATPWSAVGIDPDLAYVAKQVSKTPNQAAEWIVTKWPQWSVTGLPRTTSYIWNFYNFSPADSTKWRDAGFGATEAMEWGGTFTKPSSPQTMSRHPPGVPANLPPLPRYDLAPTPSVSGLPVLSKPVLTPVPTPFSGRPLLADEAKTWKAAGFNYEQARLWVGVERPSKVDSWKYFKFGSQEATLWHQAGFSTRNAFNWRSYKFSIPKALEWSTAGISSGHAGRSAEKGFTAAEALQAQEGEAKEKQARKKAKEVLIAQEFAKYGCTPPVLGAEALAAIKISQMKEKCFAFNGRIIKLFADGRSAIMETYPEWRARVGRVPIPHPICYVDFNRVMRRDIWGPGARVVAVVSFSGTYTYTDNFGERVTIPRVKQIK